MKYQMFSAVFLKRFPYFFQRLGKAFFPELPGMGAFAFNELAADTKQAIAMTGKDFEDTLQAVWQGPFVQNPSPHHLFSPRIRRALFFLTASLSAKYKKLILR